MYHKPVREFQGVNSDCRGGVFSARSGEELLDLWCVFNAVLCIHVTVFYNVWHVSHRIQKGQRGKKGGSLLYWCRFQLLIYVGSEQHQQVCNFIFTTYYIACKDMEINLHKRMVDERPGSRSLQHVVQIVLEPPVAHVSPAALRAVDEGLPEQAEPGSLLPPQALGPGSTCCGGGWQQTVSRVVHHPSSGLHIFQAVAFVTVPRRRPHPEPGAAFVSAVVPGHGITKAGIKCAEFFSSMRVLSRERCPERTTNYTCEAQWNRQGRAGREMLPEQGAHTLTALFPLASTPSQAIYTTAAARKGIHRAWLVRGAHQSDQIRLYGYRVCPVEPERKYF